MIANRNGDAQDLQHAAYLEINCGDGELTLRWSSGVNYTVEHAIVAFRNIYPLQQWVEDILLALQGNPIVVLIPEIEELASKLSNNRAAR
ncbi:hypothetical protein [Motiliproteus sp. MSK22-1]|uniref:hypothetical protein n=1 Tax=Motiliproteus sp. MSK22-1 TaxID=1897630 RepID=UPI001E442740|nr:hypothetical protein [Motiliproteus sp. MSK22-1]